MNSIDNAISNGAVRELTMDELTAVGGGDSLVGHVASGAAGGAATGGSIAGPVGAAVGAVVGAVVALVEHLME